MERENMKLIIDGNAVYELDQDCMNRGLNQDREKKKSDSVGRNMERNYNYSNRKTEKDRRYG